MTAPDTVKNLVERFEQHRDAYRSGRYNETQLRREFLDPFFEALGWDVFNKQSYAEIYKDVIHEDSLEIEGENKAPDYAFRIGGTRKFFVEAKRPSVNKVTIIFATLAPHCVWCSAGEHPVGKNDRQLSVLRSQ